MPSPVVAGLRKQYPGYDDIADEDFVTAIHDAHYKDMSEEDFLTNMDDAYSPKSPMQPKTHWGDNVLHALGDAAKTMPVELWKDLTGMGSGYGKGFGAGALEAQNLKLPNVSPQDMRDAGYTPKQIHNVLKGVSDIQQSETGALQTTAEQATGEVARGAAFLATLPIGGEMTGVGGPLAKQLTAKLGESAVGGIIKNPWVRHAALGALGVGAYSGVKTGLEEGKLDNVPGAVAGGAAMGAVAGPVFAHALSAVGSVLTIPKNIVAGYAEASTRIAAQAEAAGRATAQSFADKWVANFKPDNIRNFPEIHNALGNGTIKPNEAANLLLDNLRSSRPGGFLDDKVLDDPEARATLANDLEKKLGRWWLNQPSARLQLRTLPKPEIPLTETAGNAIPQISTPEPNVLGEMRATGNRALSQQQNAAHPVEPNVQLGPERPAAPGQAPIEGNTLTGPSSAGLEPNVVDLQGAPPAAPLPVEPTAGLEGNVPPAPTPLTIEGAAQPAATQPAFNTPPSTVPPLGVHPGPTLEPNTAGQLGGDLQGAGQAVQPGTPPGSPLDVQNPVTALEGAQAGATAATEAPTLDPTPRQIVDTGAGPQPTARDMTMTTAVGGRTPAPGSLAASIASDKPMPQWQEFIDALGPEQGNDIRFALEKDLTPVAAELAQAPVPPAPGRWHQIDMFADANIAAAKARMEKRGIRLNMFIDPADVADISIIGANYILKGTTSLAEWSEKMVGEFGDNIKPHLQRLYGEAKAVFEGRRPEGVDPARRIAADYLRGIGLGPGTAPAYNEFNHNRGAKVATAYQDMIDVDKVGSGPDWQKAKNAYKALVQEVREQYQHLLDSGVTIEFVPDRDPYPNQVAMSADVQNNMHLRVTGVTDAPHSMMTAEDSNQLRAVFDFFGHVAEGYPYGPRGEENAWYNHARMFSDDAIPAFTTETRGQNAVGFEHSVAATPKAGLMPEWTYQDIIKGRQRAGPRLAAGNKNAQEVGTQNIEKVAKDLSYGISRTTNPNAQRARALADGMSGIPDWQARNKNSKNWYSKSIDDMMAQTEKEIPSLADNPAKQGIFKLFLAVSSMGNRPVINYDYATKMFEGYANTGRMPMLGRIGQEQGLFGRTAAPKFAALLKRFNGDESALVAYLMSQDAQGRYAVVQEFGPKIGRFFLNLSGVPSEVTVDRWMVRWWNRLAGQRAIVDVPTEAQRKLISGTIQELAARFNISPAQTQATLWDREKNIWRSAGLRDPGDMDFSQAAKLVIANRKASIPKGIAALDAQLNPPVLPSIDKQTEQITQHLKETYPARTAEAVIKEIATGGTRWGSRPYWLDHDGVLYGPVPMHGPAMKDALKAARIGEDAIGYKGNDTGNYEQKWVHGGLQKGFVRVNVGTHEISAQTAKDMTPAQRSTIAQLQRGRNFFGEVVQHNGQNPQFAEAWTAFRRLMESEGDK